MAEAVQFLDLLRRTDMVSEGWMHAQVERAARALGTDRRTEVCEALESQNQIRKTGRIGRAWFDLAHGETETITLEQAERLKSLAVLVNEAEGVEIWTGSVDGEVMTMLVNRDNAVVGTVRADRIRGKLGETAERFEPTTSGMVDGFSAGYTMAWPVEIDRANALIAEHGLTLTNRGGVCVYEGFAGARPIGVLFARTSDNHVEAMLGVVESNGTAVKAMHAMKDVAKISDSVEIVNGMITTSLANMGATFDPETMEVTFVPEGENPHLSSDKAKAFVKGKERERQPGTDEEIVPPKAETVHEGIPPQDLSSKKAQRYQTWRWTKRMKPVKGEIQKPVKEDTMTASKAGRLSALAGQLGDHLRSKSMDPRAEKTMRKFEGKIGRAQAQQIGQLLSTVYQDASQGKPTADSLRALLSQASTMLDSAGTASLMDDLRHTVNAIRRGGSRNFTEAQMRNLDALIEATERPWAPTPDEDEAEEDDESSSSTYDPDDYGQRTKTGRKSTKYTEGKEPEESESTDPEDVNTAMGESRNSMMRRKWI
jgi:hypothetical protein